MEVVSDVTKADETRHENKVFSNAVTLGDNFSAYLRNVTGFIFDQTSAINKFVDDSGGRARGIVFTIIIGILRDDKRYSSPKAIDFHLLQDLD